MFLSRLFTLLIPYLASMYSLYIPYILEFLHQFYFNLWPSSPTTSKKLIAIDRSVQHI
jgi:hypothetical protein